MKDIYNDASLSLDKIRLFIFVVGFVWLVASSEDTRIDSLEEILESTEDAVAQCGLYLAPSLLAGAGRGVIAGMDYEVDYVIETAPTLTFPQDISGACQLDNYVFSTEDEAYSMVIFGPGSLYNHASTHQSVQHYWNDYEVKQPNQTSDLPYSDYTYCYFQLLMPALEGQELFEHYGDGWFDRFDTANDAGLNEDSTSSVEKKTCSSDSSSSNSNIGSCSDEEKTTAFVETVPADYSQRISKEILEQQGHCLTDVRIAQSLVPEAGHGLFAERSFAEGEVVTISPVLTLPRDVVDASADDSLLINYCIGRMDSDVVLFPLNYAPMINHNSTGPANLRIAWYDWVSINNDTAENELSLLSTNRLKLTPEELFEFKFAPLDLAFIASRPIAEGEELFYDYGSVWWEHWNTFLASVMEESIRLSKLDVSSPDELQPHVKEQIAARCSELCSSQLLKQTGREEEAAAQCEECTQQVLLEEARMDDWIFFRGYIGVPDGLYPEHWLLSEDEIMENYSYSQDGY